MGMERKRAGDRLRVRQRGRRGRGRERERKTEKGKGDVTGRETERVGR